VQLVVHEVEAAFAAVPVDAPQRFDLVALVLVEPRLERRCTRGIDAEREQYEAEDCECCGMPSPHHGGMGAMNSRTPPWDEHVPRRCCE
jgi:hypothetical protein